MMTLSRLLPFSSAPHTTSSCSTSSSCWIRTRMSWRVGMMRIMVVIVLTQAIGVSGSNHSPHAHKQLFRIFQAHRACNMTIANQTNPKDGGLYCKPVWDNLMCWPNYTPAGQMVQQPCAHYIDGFNTKEKAHRFCTESGIWALHPNNSINRSWTNFMGCTKRKEDIDPGIAHHMPIVTLISTIGYSISLAFLLVATVIMVGFKKLHCQRNTIHVNLFLSFMVRAVVSLVRNGALVRGFAFSWDIEYAEDGTITFLEGKTHWECKLLNTLHHYALGANYTWIFVEGVYLHTLIFFAVFSQSKKFFKLYIVTGWSFPLVFVIIWTCLRVYKNNVLCWNTHEKNYYWVLEAPIIASILINFLFFLNIIRVLFTKIRNCNTRDPRRFRKLAKSTLVLIPLFGVYYIIFIVLARHRHPKIAIVHMYLEMTLNSFQGVVVGLLFCFFNGEVRSEISKRWNRHWLSRRYSVTSGRSSRAFSTTSFFLRERASLSQPPAAIGNDVGYRNSHLSGGCNNRESWELSPMDGMVNSDMYTMPRVPSDSKVAFNLNHSSDNSSQTKESSETNGTPPTSDLDPLQSEKECNGEYDHLLPIETNTNDSPKSSHSSSKSFPSSNCLSLVKSQTVIKHNGIKKT